MGVGRVSLDNVERIAPPGPDELDRRYLRRGRPVVLAGMYADDPTRLIADPAAAYAALADVPMLTLFEPGAELGRGGPPAERFVPYAELYDRFTGTDGRPEFCVEHDTPPGLAAFVPPPPYLHIGEPGDAWESHTFMAAAGARVHLHYDPDLRNVLMVQLMGRKRYVIVDPSQTAKLAPGMPPEVRCGSALFLENFSDEDLAGFLRYTHAWDCVLGPGDALLIPAGAWHYVEYLDTALSVNFRFGRNRYTRFLAEAFPLPGVELQSIATCFRDPDAVGAREARAFARLRRAAARRYADDDAHHDAVDQLCVELCEQLGLPVAAAMYHVADIERRARLAASAGRPARRGTGRRPLARR